MKLVTRSLIVPLLFATACTGTATYSATASGTVYTPDLVEVEPGVQVIADYDEPVFYSDNYYWRNNGGHWYRSATHDRGWVEAQPPAAVVHIQSPERYRHYRPAGYQPKNRNQPAVRDHRTPPPVTRDHRDDKHPDVRDHRDGDHHDGDHHDKDHDHDHD